MPARSKKKIICPISKKKEHPEFTRYLMLMVFVCFNYPKKKALVILKRFRNADEIIPEDYSDVKLARMYNLVSKQKNFIKKFIISNQKGGYYLKRLEEKRDKPITGADLSRLLDEVQGITSNFRYAPEGRFLTNADVMLSLMRGDEESFKAYLKFFVLPNFYKLFPIPHLINIFGVDKTKPPNDYVGKQPLWERYEDIGDYLLTYQAYMKAKNQYYVDQGMVPPSVLKPGFIDKLTEKIDQVATKYSMAKMQLNPKRMIIM